eukprot:gene8713-biopygen13693
MATPAMLHFRAGIRCAEQPRTPYSAPLESTTTATAAVVAGQGGGGVWGGSCTHPPTRFRVHVPPRPLWTTLAGAFGTWETRLCPRPVRVRSAFVSLNSIVRRIRSASGPRPLPFLPFSLSPFLPFSLSPFLPFSLLGGFGRVGLPPPGDQSSQRGRGIPAERLAPPPDPPTGDPPAGRGRGGVAGDTGDPRDQKYVSPQIM